MFCIDCGKEAGDNRICPYCGFEIYVDVPESVYRDARAFMNGAYASKSQKKRGFTDEEILALGLYPKDEGYKMSLISRILGKRK